MKKDRRDIRKDVYVNASEAMAIDQIRGEFGLSSDSDVIRYAIHELANRLYTERRMKETGRSQEI